MRESTFTLVYWGFIPSFSTKGQLVFAMILTILVRCSSKSFPHVSNRGRRTATIKADCVCDLRALTRAALLEALSQYPGDKESKGQLQGVKTPQVALEWQRWADVIFL